MEKVIIGIEAKRKLFKGVKLLADAVGCTLGPKGRNVIIQRLNGNHITKDGVTVAQHVVIEDPIERMGAEIIREVSKKIATKVGDGTTTATVIANKLIQCCAEDMIPETKTLSPSERAFLAEETIPDPSESFIVFNPVDVKSGIDRAMEDVLNLLHGMKHEVDDMEIIKAIATISSNNDAEIGKIIYDAYSAIGKDGFIRIQESASSETYFKKLEGVTIPKGMVSAAFATNKADLSFVGGLTLIAIFDQKLNKSEQVLPMLNAFISVKNMRPKQQLSLIVMVNDIEGEALSLLINNARHNVVVIRNMSIGDRQKEVLDDIAALTGATVISMLNENAIKPNQFRANHFGQCESIHVTTTETALLGLNSNIDIVDGRIKKIKDMLENEFNLPAGEVKKLKMRLSMLNSNAAIIYAGAFSEVALKEKMDRIEDAVYAAKAAIDYGYIAGGGVPLAKIAESLRVYFNPEQFNPSERVGYLAVLSAIAAPYYLIGMNAGITSKTLKKRLMDPSEPSEAGYDISLPLADQRLRNLIEIGIVDPAQVTILSVQTACSVASTLLLTETVLLMETNFAMTAGSMR